MTRRPAVRPLFAGVLVLLALLAAGCGVRPSDVIEGRPALGGPAAGISLYLVRDGELALVLRPNRQNRTPTDVIGLLVAGPDDNERSQGFTTEVPASLGRTAALGPVTAGSGIGVTLSGPVAPLSATAVDQIVCTLRDAVGNASVRITVRGSDGERQAEVCPLY
ncbi:GerMN domain-containing protein [Micromonospora sp. URMC 103]|uniref:GerMN domain-containing protein n=1 Tax=Micromonospora sp. URMC 103 TaxID=3423406 RepID=UPI003F1BED59